MSSSVMDSPVADTVDQLIADEERVFLRRQPRSSELIDEARVHLAGGAASNWQIAEPQAVWMSHGLGSKVYDVDGTSYVDMHGGYGASIAGHAHPAIVEAVSERVRRGTHFDNSVQVSVLPEADEVGPRDRPNGVPGNSGIPSAIRDLVIVVPFNDTGAVERALAEHPGQVAAMILEPVMMNAGTIPPDDGYLAVIRDLVHSEGAYLI